jgi:hypothetical protein
MPGELDSTPESNPLDQQLRLLAWLHYLLGGLTAATLPAWVYIAAIGKPLLYPEEAPRDFGPGDEASLLMGAMLLCVGVVMAALSLMHGAVLWYLGRCLVVRKRWLLVVVVSAFNLTYIPLGTIVSLLTIVALTRPGVKQQFQQPRDQTA